VTALLSALVTELHLIKIAFTVRRMMKQRMSQ